MFKAQNFFSTCFFLLSCCTSFLDHIFVIVRCVVNSQLSRRNETTNGVDGYRFVSSAYLPGVSSHRYGKTDLRRFQLTFLIAIFFIAIKLSVCGIKHFGILRHMLKTELELYTPYSEHTDHCLRHHALPIRLRRIVAIKIGFD